MQGSLEKSVNRVCKLVCRNVTEVRIFKALASKIEDVCGKENVLLLFDVLSGTRQLQEARQLVSKDLLSEFDTIHNKDWTKLKHWSRWWCRVNHLTMFTRAFKEMDDMNWEQGPSTAETMKDTWLILPIELTAMQESLKGGQTGLRI